MKFFVSRTIACFVLILMWPVALDAQESQPASQPSIAGILEEIRVKHNLPGMGAAVISGSEVRALGVSGFRRAGSDVRVTLDDKWHLGSCTKAMTAVHFGRQVDRGETKFDTSLREALGKEAAIHTTLENVTLRHLMSHRAGLPTDLSEGGLWGKLWNHPGTPAEQRRLLCDELLPREPIHPPGSKFQYTNAGFMVAGRMMEVRTGKNWEELIHADVFQPLGMKSAGFGAPARDAKTIDQPMGHRAAGSGYRAIPPGRGDDNPSGLGPAGTVHGSLQDWALFLKMLLDVRHGRSNFLKFETLKELVTPVGEGADYALGWRITERPWAKGRILTHGGSNTMWFCVAWVALDADFAILVTTNAGGDGAMKAADQAVGNLMANRSSW